MPKCLPKCITDSNNAFNTTATFFLAIFLTWLTNCILIPGKENWLNNFEGPWCFGCHDDLLQDYFHNAVFLLSAKLLYKRQREKEWLESPTCDRHQHSHTGGYLHLRPAWKCCLLCQHSFLTCKKCFSLLEGSERYSSYKIPLQNLQSLWGIFCWFMVAMNCHRFLLGLWDWDP